MKQLRFRTRLFFILSLFALVPSLAVTIAWAVFVSRAAPVVAGTAAWERLATSGAEAIGAMDSVTMTDAQKHAIRAHERELEQSVTQSRRLSFVARRAAPVIVLGSLALLVVLGGLASRAAGHLSRQLSRPLNELVGWAQLIERTEPLPTEGIPRGAPEFRVLRERMRAMSGALATGRARAMEAERLRAFRESARRVAHELKNPLTPIQFAIARIKRDAPPELGDAIEVLDVETSRLQELARAFSQFGRLPEGAPSDVDVGELVRYAAMSSIPPHLQADVRVDDDLPMVRGHYDALQRALTNILLNAVDACGSSGRILVAATRTSLKGAPGVEVSVQDTGCGIPADQLQRIWEPYVTSKPAGTGLGLAIAHQTILAHHGYVAAESEPTRGTVVRFAVPSSGVESSVVES
ncbi:MAG: ATP-binding protein [Gemmatimonadaceae bacterium]